MYRKSQACTLLHLPLLYIFCKFFFHYRSCLWYWAAFICPKPSGRLRHKLYWVFYARCWCVFLIISLILVYADFIINCVTKFILFFVDNFLGVESNFSWFLLIDKRYWVCLCVYFLDHFRILLEAFFSHLKLLSGLKLSLILVALFFRIVIILSFKIRIKKYVTQVL